MKRSESGQSTAEFALLLPFVVLLLLSIVQVALIVREQVQLTYATREVARQASVSPDLSRAQQSGRKVNPDANFQISRPAKIGEHVEVRARDKFATRVPMVGVLFPDVALSAYASMRVEK